MLLPMCGYFCPKRIHFLQNNSTELFLKRYMEFGDDGNGLAEKLRWAAAQFEQHFPDGTLSLELHEGNGDSGDGQSGSAAHSAALAQPFLSFDRGLVTCSDRFRPHDRWKGGVCWL